MLEKQKRESPTPCRIEEMVTEMCHLHSILNDAEATGWIWKANARAV